MEWGYVPEAGRNGIILSYTVSYQESSDGIRQTKEVNAPTRQVTLLRLKECTTYNIEVSAATSKWHTHERYMVQVVFLFVIAVVFLALFRTTVRMV